MNGNDSFTLNLFKNKPFHSNIKYKYKMIMIISPFVIIVIFLILFSSNNSESINRQKFKKKNIELVNPQQNLKDSFSLSPYEFNQGLDLYEKEVFLKIKNRLKLSQMWANQNEFINGVVRKFLPKKILEVGVAFGGSSAVILNAIQNINNSHLYSIDVSTDINIGIEVKKNFPELMNKWTLYKGIITASIIEEIGNNIDMVLLDTSHLEPGEILDIIMILPFLKEEAIVIMHDIANQITQNPFKQRTNYAPFRAFNMLAGLKFYPSGNYYLTQDIGGMILEKNQGRFIYDYFRNLGGQWQYYPKEEHIQIIKEYINKYYDKYCQKMFEETITFNKQFTKKYPLPTFYQKSISN